MNNNGLPRLLNFSPEGRLYQIEYALDAIKFGSNTIGIKNNSGALILTEKPQESTLTENNGVSKLIALNHFLGCGISGLTSDARFLIEKTFLYLENNNFIFNSLPSTENCARKIRDLISFSSFGDKEDFVTSRPFGIAFLVIGVDFSGINLFSVDPSGEYLSQDICALGGASKEAIFTAREGYRKKMSFEETQILAQKIFKSILKKDFDEIKLEMGTIDRNKKRFLVIQDHELRQIFHKN
jgi:20S proteasome subunit alpha 5